MAGTSRPRGGSYSTSQTRWLFRTRTGVARPIPHRATGAARFSDFGVNVRVIPPGEPSSLYHSENAQEGFLVLSGECTLVVEEDERRLRQWDYFHCPADTHHITVGAGDAPCVVLMIGARREAERLHYPASEVAAKYGASAAKDTNDPDEAYAEWPGEYEPVRLPWPLVESDAKP